MPNLYRLLSVSLLFTFLFCDVAFSQITKFPLKFDFGTGEVAQGYTQITSLSKYSKEIGYGFDLGSEVFAVDRGGKDPLFSDFMSSHAPIFFSVDVPEGNYRITLTLGDLMGSSETTIKAESRRLMAHKIITKSGTVKTQALMVNVYHPEIDGGDKVQLKDRELDKLDWDHKLTLEFNDLSPKIAAVEIERVEDAVTLYLTGNSTVTNQKNEPWASWGQMLPSFFNSNRVCVSNQASSGLTLKEFQSSNRLKNVLSHMKAGDYLFIQFAHNDQKKGINYVDPYGDYQKQLLVFIQEARTRGAKPVLVTSMHRRRFDEDGQIINTLGDYPEAMRQLAKRESIPLIDLHAMSEVLYESLGVMGSRDLFVHYPAGTFPGQQKEYVDNTHFSSYGAFELAKCIVEGIRLQIPELAKELRKDVEAYDPSNPKPYSMFTLPMTPIFENWKPGTN